jgi:hypothetical protein
MSDLVGASVPVGRDDRAAWLAANDRYLEAALTWLRLRIERVAARTPAGTAAGGERVTPVTSFIATPVEPPKRSWWRGPEPDVLPVLEAVPALEPLQPSQSPARDHDAEVEAAFRAMKEVEAATSPAPALLELAALFDLGDFARDLLLLAAAPDLDPPVARALVALHGQPWPTFSVAAQVLDAPDWESRSPGGSLRRWHLVDADVATGGLSSCALRVDERVLDALKGLHQVDTRLAGLMVPLAPPDATLPPSQEEAVGRAVQLAQTAGGDTPLTIVQLVGPASEGRRLIARQVAATLGGGLSRLQPRLLPTAADDLDQVARLWHREVVLTGRVLLIDEEDGEPAGPETAGFLARTGGLVLVGGGQVARGLPGSPGVVDVSHPTVEEQLGLWMDVLGDEGGAPEGMGAVVEQFDLDSESIAAVAALARADLDPTEPLTASDLWDAARRHRRPRLESVAQRVRAVATWEDLVLPEHQVTQLEQVASQVRHRHRVHRDWGFAARMNRGLGVSALFAGESGTGKSMTAEVLAQDLDLDLYRIDLSAVVSKYIGETEKNLRQLFDAAEGGGVILFFDEADALFGKRSEVKDAHDRYANIETNYLLQRMEQYGGLAILATNMRSALDKAFARRLRFVVEFPFPDREHREVMWKRAFPPDVPVEDLDLSRLARIDLTGAGIASAALAASFAAAAEDRPVELRDVLAAAREELRKLQRPVIESQFRVPDAGATEEDGRSVS